MHGGLPLRAVGFSRADEFGIVIFRWAVLVSVIVTLSSISYAHRGILIIPDIAFGLMRSVSILELCLLGFPLPEHERAAALVRDLAFGIALGFGLLSSNDFVGSPHRQARIPRSLTPFQFVYESVILASLGIWVAYCALPEPARKPMVVPANSTIYRWNEIASALGHTGTRSPCSSPPTASSSPMWRRWWRRC